MKHVYRRRTTAIVIARAREDTGLSQRQLAEKLGVSSNWVHRVETLQCRVDVAEFIALARSLGIEPCTLLARVLKDTD